MLGRCYQRSINLLSTAVESIEIRPRFFYGYLATWLKTNDYQLSDGCPVINACRYGIPQLSATNRKAVHAACRDCREAIATQLAALRSGGDLTSVRGDSNSAIDRLTTTIKRMI